MNSIQEIMKPESGKEVRIEIESVPEDLDG